jgi:hypothetical protein
VPAVKLENITWSSSPDGIILPSEAIIEITEEEYLEGMFQSMFHKVLEEYTNVPVESFTMEVIMKRGPVLKYRKQRKDELVFSGPLW